VSPGKAEFSAIKDRMQAMQIINQYIKESQVTMKTGGPGTSSQQFPNDPYSFLTSSSPEKTQQSFSNHIYHTEKKLTQQRLNIMDP